MSTTPASPVRTAIPLHALRCRACASRILRRLRRVGGVHDARIEAFPAAAIVTHDRGLDAQRLEDAVREAGGDPSAAEIALPVSTAAGGEEGARAVERALVSIEGVLAAAVDPLRHEVRAVYRHGAVLPDTIRAAAARLGWDGAHDSGGLAAGHPAQERAARRSLLRAALVTVAATLVTALGALTGPGALAPLLQSIPGAAAALRSSIGIAPVPALWITAAIALVAIGWGGADFFRRAALDGLRTSVTTRFLGAAAVATLAVAAVVGAAGAVLGRPAPPLLFGVTTWALAVVLWKDWLTAWRVVRRRAHDAAAARPLRDALAQWAWYRGAPERRAISVARSWAIGSFAAGLVAGGIWIALGASWSIAALAAAAVVLAASPSAFIAAAACPPRLAAEALAADGVSVLGGETLDRLRDVAVVGMNVRGGLCDGRARIAELLMLQGASVDELLSAAAAGIPSDHPLAAAIRERASNASRSVPDPLLGSVRDLTERGVDMAPIADDVARFEAEGKSVLAVASGDRLLGALTIAFDPRDHAAETVRALGARGIRTVLLTRNPHGTAAALATRFGMPGFTGGLRAPFESPLFSADAAKGLRAWISAGDDLLSTGRADMAVTFAGMTERIAMEDAVITHASLAAVRRLFEAADQAARSTAVRTRWLVAYHVLALPLAGGALLPLTELLPAPLLAAAGSLVALALAGGGQLRRRNVTRVVSG